MYVEIALHWLIMVAGTGPFCTGLHPGRASRSMWNIHLSAMGVLTEEERRLTAAFYNFINANLLGTAVHVSIRDLGQLTAGAGLATHVSAAIHGPLQRVILPAEDVISMLSEA